MPSRTRPLPDRPSGRWSGRETSCSSPASPRRVAGGRRAFRPGARWTEHRPSARAFVSDPDMPFRRGGGSGAAQRMRRQCLGRAPAAVLSPPRSNAGSSAGAAVGSRIGVRAARVRCRATPPPAPASSPASTGAPARSGGSRMPRRSPPAPCRDGSASVDRSPPGRHAGQRARRSAAGVQCRFARGALLLPPSARQTLSAPPTPGDRRRRVFRSPARSLAAAQHRVGIEQAREAASRRTGPAAPASRVPRSARACSRVGRVSGRSAAPALSEGEPGRRRRAVEAARPASKRRGDG
mgnify:CR=1 FL=1